MNEITTLYFKIKISYFIFRKEVTKIPLAYGIAL